MWLRSFFFASLLLLCLVAFAPAADNEEISNLKLLLKTASGRKQVDLLNEISKAYWGVSSDETISWAQDARTQAQNLGYEAGEACALRYIGIGYWYKDDYKNALTFTYQALAIYERLGDLKGIAACKSTIGTVYLNLERLDEALKMYLSALPLAEKAGDENRVGILVSNIGTTYLGLKKYEEALTYFFRAKEILERSGSKLDILTCLGNIGGAYRRLNQLDKALEIDNQILQLATEVDSKARMADALTDIGEVLSLQGKFPEAVNYLERAVALAEKEGLRRNLQDAQLRLAQFYEKQNRHEQALNHYKQYLDVRDSLFTEENAKALADLQVKYETEKKEKEIQIQRLEIERQRYTRNALVGLSLFVFLIAAVTHSRYRAKQRANELLEKLSRTDPLTGLSNRRALLEAAEAERLRWQRRKAPFSMILADIDHFKQFNDRYGHEMGDRVLIEVADAIRSSVREIDIPARWGGEEFLVFLPECDPKNSGEIAHRIQQKIRSISIDHDGKPLKVTATFGASTYDADEALETCLKRADVALYEGKRQGRDCIVLSQAAQPEPA